MTFSNNGRIRVNVTGARGALGIDLQGSPTPGQYLVKGAGGGRAFVPVTPPGQIADAVALTDLASGAGASLVGTSINSGQLSRSLYEKIYETVSVEDFGAIGDGVANDRAAIQKSIDYASENNILRVVFKSTNYAIWHTERTGEYTGHGLVVNGKIVLESLCGRTNLLMLSPEGESLENNFQVVDGNVWRGGGIYVRGVFPDPGYSNRNSLQLRGIFVQGGCAFTGNHNFPVTPESPDGWDITNKGIWAQDDTFVGDISLYDSGVIGFKGEVLYGAGVQASKLILRNVELGESNANLLNMTREEVDVDGLYGYNAHCAWEGWSGRQGRLVNARFRNITVGAGRLQGGRFNGSGLTEYPTRWSANEVPLLTIDAEFINCGTDVDGGKTLKIGSWVRGRIRAVDTTVAINCISNEDLIVDSQLIIESVADQKSFDAVAILGRENGTEGIKNLSISVICDRTEYAISSGFAVNRPVTGGGGIGAGVVIENGFGPCASWPRASFDFSTYRPAFIENNWTLVSANEATAQNIGVTASGSINPRMGHAFVFGSSASTYDIYISTANRQIGEELYLYFDPQAGSSFKLTSGVGNLLLRQASYTLHDRRIILKFNGSKWTEKYVENWS